MSSCCPDSSCENGGQVCPKCGEKGVSLDPITLKALLTSEALRRGVPQNPRFCATATCPVVYFDAEVVFTEPEIVVAVHAKHPDVDEINRCGKATAFATITAEVKAGHCACEVRNPKGDCCLGDVFKTEQRLMSELVPAAR